MGKIMHQGVNYSSINDAEHLSNLQDTQISNPADGNILQYDGNTNKWKNTVAQEHTTFNGRSGSILPMAGDYSADKITFNNTISGLSATDIKSAIDELSSEKQNALTFDDTPTQNSINPITSRGVYNAINTAIASVLSMSY